MAIVILNWNNMDETMECVASAVESEYPSQEIIVVDNASTRGDVGALQTPFPRIRILVNSRNIGYAGGNNVGVREAQRLGCTYALILNNDARLARDAVSKLISALEADPRAAAACPKILHGLPPSRTIYYAGSHISLRLGRNYFRGYGETDVGQYDSAEETENISGAAVLLRLDALHDKPAFREDYFLYAEDMELAIRLRRSGWRILYCPDAVAWHKGKVSSNPRRGPGPITSYFDNRNTFRLVMEFGNLSQKIFYIAYRFAVYTPWFIIYALRTGRREALWPFWRATRDAIFGTRGQDDTEMVETLYRRAK